MHWLCRSAFQLVENMADPIDEDIAKEEHLIQVYEAEMKILESRESNVRLNTLEEDDKDEENDDTASCALGPLDWILEKHDEEEAAGLSRLMDAMKESPENPFIDALQPKMRGISFTSIKHVEALSNHVHVYVFKGFFIDHSHVKVEITLRLQFDADYSTGSVLESICQVFPDVNMPQHHDGNISEWVHSMCNYLDFNAQRQKIIEEHSGLVSATEASRSNAMQLGVRLPNNREYIALSLLWGWKWKDGKDVLRVARSNLPGIGQSHLDGLVRTCDNKCAEALQKMLRHLGGSVERIKSKCREVAVNYDPDSAEDSEDSDEEQSSSRTKKRRKSLTRAKRKQSDSLAFHL